MMYTKQMNVLHFMTTGGTGGIENLMREYSYKSKLNNYFVIFWGSGINSDKIKLSGGNVIELKFGKNALIKTYTYLSKVIEDEKIDSIVTHHSAPFLYIVMYMLKMRYTFLKTYIYAHGNISDMLRENKIGSKVRKRILKTVFKKTNNVIAISNSVKNSFINYGFNNSKIVTIYNGVACDKFENIDIERNNSTKRIVFVGRLIPQKGVDRLIRAIASLETERSYICEIVGDGEAKEDLLELVKKLKVDDKVIFHGTRSDIPEFLSCADFFVHPARWEEGFGIALVEAMSAGVIPIAYNKGAISEIIDNGINGYIVQEETVENLSKSIEYVLNEVSEDELTEMRNNARKKAYSFNMDIYVKRLDSFLLDGVI